MAPARIGILPGTGSSNPWTLQSVRPRSPVMRCPSRPPASSFATGIALPSCCCPSACAAVLSALTCTVRC